MQPTSRQYRTSLTQQESMHRSQSNSINKNSAHLANSRRKVGNRRISVFQAPSRANKCQKRASSQDLQQTKLLKTRNTDKIKVQKQFISNKAEHFELSQIAQAIDISITPAQRKAKAQIIWQKIDKEYFQETSQGLALQLIKEVLQTKFLQNSSDNPLQLSSSLASLTGYQFDHIDEAIDSLLDELSTTVRFNHTKIGELPIQLAKQQPKIQFLSGDIFDTVDMLHWASILRYFVRGFTDKSRDILKRFQSHYKKSRPTKFTKEIKKQSRQCWTQCKICFCCQDQWQNCILYCDGCSTSYHQYCYGIPNFPEQEVYKCDVCIWKQSQIKPKQVRCQICKKTSFPIKRLMGHFYHVTCLVLDNFVSYKSKTLKHRQNVNSDFITSKISDCEFWISKSKRYCEFCPQSKRCRKGIQVPCSWPGCQASFHSICGYLAGCEIKLKIIWEKSVPFLEINAVCTNHQTPFRDIRLQAYLRRLICSVQFGLKKTEEEFQKEYAKEEQQRIRRKLQIEKLN